MVSIFVRVAAVTALVGGGLAVGSPGVTMPIAGASTATGWTAPVTLAEAGTPVSASVSASGDVAAVWRSPDGFAIAVHPDGGSWSSATSVAPHATSARTAYDGKGRLVLAWTDQRPDRPTRLRVRVRATDGSWGSADTVTLRERGSIQLDDLAVGPSGATLLGWQWTRAEGTNALATRGRAGGVWTTGLRVRQSTGVRVALGDGGLAAAVVQRAVANDDGGADLTLLAARQARGHAWQAPVVLQRLTGFGPPWPGIGGIHVDRTGRTTVAWDDRSPAGVWRIVAVRAVQGQPWQRPTVLARHVGWGDFPVVVTGAQRGDVLVTFVRQPGNRRLEAVRWARPGWQPPVSVSGRVSYVSDWDAATDPSGAALTVWTPSDGPGTSGRGVTVALMSPSGGWDDPQRLSKAETPDGHARVAAKGATRAAALWTQRVGDQMTVRVREHE